MLINSWNVSVGKTSCLFMLLHILYAKLWFRATFYTVRFYLSILSLHISFSDQGSHRLFAYEPLQQESLYLVLLKYKEKYDFPIRSDLMDIHTCFYFFVIPTSAKNLRKIWSEVQIVIGNIMSSTSHEDVVVALLSDGGSGSCIQQSRGNKEIAVIVHGRTLCCLRSVDDVDTY